MCCGGDQTPISSNKYKNNKILAFFGYRTFSLCICSNFQNYNFVQKPKEMKINFAERYKLKKHIKKICVKRQIYETKFHKNRYRKMGKKKKRLKSLLYRTKYQAKMNFAKTNKYQEKEAQAVANFSGDGTSPWKLLSQRIRYVVQNICLYINR